MSSRVRWFVAGMSFALLLIGAATFGVMIGQGDADAQGTWQVKEFPVSLASGDAALGPDPDRFPEDWVKTLPANCDIVPSHAITTYFYRCL